MTLFTMFAHRRERDLFNTCRYLLGTLKVNFTNSGLSEALHNHVAYPSLLSIKDVLFEYGIASAAIEKGPHSYEAFETPFICSIQQDDWPRAGFTIVTRAENGQIEYLDSLTDRLTQLPLDEFEKMDKHIILLLDTANPKHELNLAANRKKQRDRMLLKRVPLCLALAAILFAAGHLFSLPVGMYTWIGTGFLLFSFLGLAVSSLLIWNEIDAHNPFIKEVCGGKGKKVNCDAVLSSSRASFMGISWAVWGFSFFAVFFTTQILFPGNMRFLLLWSVISLLVAPYVLFSVFYQWKVVKQWCPLCLAVQVVLAANTTIAAFCLSGNAVLSEGFTRYPVAVVILGGLSFLLLTNAVIPELKSARDGRDYEKKWKKLRYNPEIFEALLDKSDRVIAPVDGLGIVVGNPHATHEIIKVCNPFCGPCAKAHPELEHIIHTNPDVRLRIIFAVSGEGGDIRTRVVAHLMAIQQKYDPVSMQSALDDWYLAPVKNYDTFAQKYPMNGELSEQSGKILAMRDWCETMKIRATPTIYINGRELPDSYRVTELKNFF